MLQNNSLTSAPQLRKVVPPTIFFKEGSKIGSKFSKYVPITLAVVGTDQRNFAAWYALRWGCVKQVQLLRGTATSKFGRAKKHPKFGVIYDNFQVW